MRLSVYYYITSKSPWESSPVVSVCSTSLCPKQNVVPGSALQGATENTRTSVPGVEKRGTDFYGTPKMQERT